MSYHPSTAQPAEWNRIREEILKRDNYECQSCGRSSDHFSLSVHHILPVSKGGEEDDDNLVTVCERCHDLIHRLGTGPEYPLSILDDVDTPHEQTREEKRLPSPHPDLSGFHNLSKVRRDVLAVTATYDWAVGARVAEDLEERYKEPVSRPTVHTALDKLEEEGYIEVEQSDSTYHQHSVTKEGELALRIYHAWLTDLISEI